MVFEDTVVCRMMSGIRICGCFLYVTNIGVLRLVEDSAHFKMCLRFGVQAELIGLLKNRVDIQNLVVKGVLLV